MKVEVWRIVARCLAIVVVGTVFFSVKTTSKQEMLTDSHVQKGKAAFYKGESQEKKFSGDWKEGRRSLCSPAQTLLGGSGDFVASWIHFCRDDAFGS